jgi:hypothetical protein
MRTVRTIFLLRLLRTKRNTKMKNTKIRMILGTFVAIAVAAQVIATPNCDYTANPIAPGGPHCHDVGAASGTGWSPFGNCKYFFCDSAVPCNGNWTMKERNKTILYKVVNGITVYGSSYVTDTVQGCCSCNSTYVERPL